MAATQEEKGWRKGKRRSFILFWHKMSFYFYFSNPFTSCDHIPLIISISISETPSQSVIIFHPSAQHHLKHKNVNFLIVFTIKSTAHHSQVMTFSSSHLHPPELFRCHFCTKMAIFNFWDHLFLPKRIGRGQILKGNIFGEA